MKNLSTILLTGAGGLLAAFAPRIVKGDTQAMLHFIATLGLLFGAWLIYRFFK